MKPKNQVYSGRSIAEQLLEGTSLGNWLSGGEFKKGKQTYTDGYGSERKYAPLLESANGQELKRIGDTAKTAGKIAATGLAFGNPVVAEGLWAPTITGTQAYWIGTGLKDAKERVTNMVEDPNARTAGNVNMTALDIASAIPVAKTVIRGGKEIIPAAKQLLNNIREMVAPTTWLQGEDAIKMFKRYGTQFPKSENSSLIESIKKYIPEVRERYGLVENTTITDDEIAGSLYKKAMQLSGKNNAAVNEFGEPLLLFRGDTKRYNRLLERMSPEELAKNKGTMDNSLGNLFLDYPDSYQGLDRYIGTARYFNGNLELLDSGTGAKVLGGSKSFITKDGVDLPPEGSRLLYSGVFGKHKTPISVFKLPAEKMDSGVNDINAFVVKTKQVRDATPEISVLNDDWLAQGACGSTPHMSTKYIQDPDGFPLFLHPDGTTTPALGGYDNRPGMAEHYRYILDDAQKKGQGLLISKKGAPLRDEHGQYTYYAVPNFNKDNVKHLLQYNFNRPTLPFIDNGMVYRKNGGVLTGKSGIHIKPENRGKFTALKKRTGKSSTWYKEHGTPAQKKMAIFALNARKWKH